MSYEGEIEIALRIKSDNPNKGESMVLIITINEDSTEPRSRIEQLL